MDGFAGAIDAALGVEKRVDRAGLRPAVDPAIREIEGGLGQFETRKVLLGRILRHDGHGLGSAGSLEKAGSERGTAVGAGDDLADRLVAARGP